MSLNSRWRLVHLGMCAPALFAHGQQMNIGSSFPSYLNSDEPCFKTFAGNTTLAMRTLILASTAVRWAAVMINPDFRYTPAPGCAPCGITGNSSYSYESTPSRRLDALLTKATSQSQSTLYLGLRLRSVTSRMR
jgi:hypothetical protein